MTIVSKIGKGSPLGIDLCTVKTSSGVYVLENEADKQNAVKVSVFELTQARALVEDEAATLVAMSISEDELRALGATLVDMEAGEDPEKADRGFHLIAVDILCLTRTSI